MKLSELKNKYDALVGDIDFDELELGLQNPNLFEILDISSTEIRHSNFLSWLLNPDGNHGLGDTFLKRFLREIFSSDINDKVDQIEVNELDYSSVQVRREWKRIDLLILFDNVTVCIENKIKSSEHSNQLQVYKNTINKNFPNYRKVFVYLTPLGESSSDKENYIPFSYQSIVSFLERIMNVYSDSINKAVSIYIRDYITILKRELMANDRLIELSHRIYKNHREIIDFIIEHKPDINDNLSSILTEVIKDKGYIIGSDNKYRVRFTTEEIEKLTYYNQVSHWWKKGESFLFQFDIDDDTNNITFKVIASPSKDGYDSSRLCEILQEIDEFGEPRGKKWLVPYIEKLRFNYKGVEDLTDEEIYEEMESKVDKIIPTVKKVEEKFIEHKDELSKMMEIEQ